MLRVTELIENGSSYMEKTTFINKNTILSVTEDTYASRKITESRGTQVVVSKITVRLPEGAHTILALGNPDSIMTPPHPNSNKGILYG